MLQWYVSGIIYLIDIIQQETSHLAVSYKSLWNSFSNVQSQKSKRTTTIEFSAPYQYIYTVYYMEGALSKSPYITLKLLIM